MNTESTYDTETMKTYLYSDNIDDKIKAFFLYSLESATDTMINWDMSTNN